MAYLLQQVWDDIKREARAGEIANFTEQYTQDLVGYWNRFASEAWRMNNWDWNKVPISFTLPAGTTSQYTFGSTIGQIIILGVAGQDGYLRSFTEKEYRRRKPANISDQSQVYGYVKKGLDSSGNIKVLFVDSPSTATAIEGEGKLKWLPITIADVQANNAIAYFPDHVIEILKAGVAGIFMTAINDGRGPGQEAKATAALQVLMGTERSDPADEETTPCPTLITFGNANRGGSRVA